MTKDKLKRIVKQIWKENWDIIVVSLVILITFNTVLMISIVPTGSMSPVIKPYDIVVGSIIPYCNAEPERGDIVIFKGDDVNYCKRIVGLPNEELSLQEARVFINGEKLEEEYLEWKVTPSFGKDYFQIPEGHYFVMGDLRWNSMDSRYWDEPYIAREQIMSKALIVIPTHYIYDFIRGLVAVGE